MICASRTAAAVGRECCEASTGLARSVPHLHSISMAKASYMAALKFKKGRKLQPYHDPGDRELEILHE